MAWYEILATFLVISTLIGFIIYILYLGYKDQKRLENKDKELFKALDQLIKNTKKDDE